MAEKLSITIALEGAAEIKRQLAEVGQAGKDAFAEINQAAAEVGGFNKMDPSVVTDKMVKFGVSGKDAIDKVNNAVKQAGRMETLVNGLRSVENGLAGVQTAASALDSVLLKGLTRSFTLVARLLPAAFAAAVVGSISSTTKAILELDAAALKLGVSVQDLAKAQEIFKQLGLGSAEAAKGAAAFSEAMTLKNVKEAVANLDEFGRSAKSGADWFKILEEAAKGVGPAADMARQKLQELGKTRVSGPELDIDRISKSAAALPEKILAMLSVFERMGNTTERNRLIFANFSQELATTIIQMLNAGVTVNGIAAALARIPAPTAAATQAAAQLALAWSNLKNLFASGFEVAPEMLNAIAASLNQIRTAMEAIGATNVFQGMAAGVANVSSEIQGVINLLACAWPGRFQRDEVYRAGRNRGMEHDHRLDQQGNRCGQGIFQRGRRPGGRCRRWRHGTRRPNGRAWFRHLGFKPGMAVARRTRHARQCGAPARRIAVARGAAPFRRQLARRARPHGALCAWWNGGCARLCRRRHQRHEPRYDCISRTARHWRLARIVGRG